jgi:hypothetical protein
VIDHVQSLLQRHRQTGLLVDTNVLLMVVIGLHDRTLIERFKRTAQYTVADFDLALWLFQRTSRVVTLQSILTEVSNLAGQLGDQHRIGAYSTFGQHIALLAELQILSVDIARVIEFPRFGLTDSAILLAARGGHLVLTDDFRLSQYMESQNLPVLNFTHLRSPNLFQ